MDPRQLDRHVAGCAAAHQRLLGHLDELGTDLDPLQPSRLPKWSVGHVLSHLARHAESQTRVFEAAAVGQAAERYPGGAESRRSGIDAGAGGSAEALVGDIRRSIWALEAAWASCPGEGWELVGTALGRPEPVHELPWRRWREVEIHHADLGLAGFSYDDWSPEYVRAELDRAVMAWRATQPMGNAQLPDRALALPPARRLAWLVGRLPVEGLPAVPQWF
jgi:maleylpyruvate isomerase